MNKDWHSKHRMPKNATIEHRIRWHNEHARVCGCRPVPSTVRAAIEGRSRRSGLRPGIPDMRTLFAVTMRRGPKWDATRTRDAQDGWREHADFMNGLAAKRFILLGGPIGDGVEVLHVIDAPDEPTIRSTLERDPWSPDLLQIRDIQPWTILLDADEDYG